MDEAEKLNGWGGRGKDIAKWCQLCFARYWNLRNHLKTGGIEFGNGMKLISCFFEIASSKLRIRVVMLQNMDEFDRDGRRLMEEFFKLFFNRNILILKYFGLIWNWFILLMIVWSGFCESCYVNKSSSTNQRLIGRCIYRDKRYSCKQILIQTDCT